MTNLKHVSDMSWHEIMKILPELYEEDVRELLQCEVEGGARPSVVRRLHQRYNSLRNERERFELMQKTGIKF